jgi:putative acetyltransferase
MRIRREEPADAAAIRAVNEAAFDSSVEADIVDVLRNKCDRLISLVAESNGRVLGHILFSPVSLSGHAHVSVMGLGPMAVLPAHQRRGIGTALVREGLSQCRKMGCDAVVVLGHPKYYPRFGFVRASRYGIGCEYDVPDDVFMVIELRLGSLQGADGKARYDDAFGSA